MLITENDDDSGWTRVECSMPGCWNEIQYPGPVADVREFLPRAKWAIVKTSRLEEARCPNCVKKEEKVQAVLSTAEGR